jgi:hypothetical protein
LLRVLWSVRFGMAVTKRVRRDSLLGSARARREWLKREIAKTDAQLKLLEGHVRAQQERINDLERVGGETTAARDFLVTLRDCQEAHETYRLRLARDLEAT